METKETKSKFLENMKEVFSEFYKVRTAEGEISAEGMEEVGKKLKNNFEIAKSLSENLSEEEKEVLLDEMEILIFEEENEDEETDEEKEKEEMSVGEKNMRQLFRIVVKKDLNW